MFGEEWQVITREREENRVVTGGGMGGVLRGRYTSTFNVNFYCFRRFFSRSSTFSLCISETGHDRLRGERLSSL